MSQPTYDGTENSIVTDSLMTIREMCEAFGVTPRTLRFYEAKELIAPIRQGQKRLFTRRDRGRLKLILRGKRFGFSLEEIRQLLDLYDLDDQQQTQLERSREIGEKHLAILESQREEIEESIADLKEQISLVSDMLSALGPKKLAS